MFCWERRSRFACSYVQPDIVFHFFITLVTMIICHKQSNIIHGNSLLGQATMIGCMMFNAVSNSISVISRWPVHLSTLLWSSFLTSIPHNILFKPLAAFPRNHCRNNGQRWERNKLLLQWQSSILGKNIGRAGYRTSDLLFSRLQRYQLIHGARWIGNKEKKIWKEVSIRWVTGPLNW